MSETTNQVSSGYIIEGAPDGIQAYRSAAHDRLAHQSRVVLRLGQMLLASGASAYRVKNSMATLAKAVGIAEHHAQVTYTEIIATAYANGTFRTGLAEQRQMGVNADRIDRLNNYVASIKGQAILVEDADKALDEIERVKPLYDWFPNAAASGLACAAFSFLNSGGWVECSAVAVAAFFGQALRRQMLHRHMNHFGVWMSCGAVAALIYILLVAPAQHFLGLEPTHQAGFISALLFLVPGFPLVTGIIDLVRHDFQGGLGRLTYVFMLLLSAGVATWVVSTVFHWSVTPEYIYILVPWLDYTLRFITSFVAAFGFAVLFNSPTRVAGTAALIGAVINVGRLALVNELDVQTPAAVGLAALAAGLLATFAAKRTRFSRVTLSVPAVVIMIPGVPFYRSLTYLNNGQMFEALQSLFTVIFTIVGIGIGLALARMLTDKNWLTESAPVVPLLDEVLPDSFSPTDSADTVANDHTLAEVNAIVGATDGEEALSDQLLAEETTPGDTSSNQELSD
ncbi:Inner membrane protein YjjP [Chlamydia trachomatis]|nr:Inner membrane protein YjjP [Chlamydia trachomatis]